MSDLVYTKNDAIIHIKPFGLEYEKEDWVKTELIFQRNKNIILKNYGAFLQLTDFKEIIEEIMNITNGSINIFELDPLEPNFEFSVKLIKDEVYSVNAAFFKTFEYEKGEIIKVHNDTNSITIETNKQNLAIFAEQLNSEIEMIK